MFILPVQEAWNLPKKKKKKKKKKKNQTCYRCGGEHLARDCPKRTSLPGQHRTYASTVQNGDQQSTLAATAAATVQNSVQNSDQQLTWAATAAANQQPGVSQVTIPAQEQLSPPAQQPVLQQRKPELRSRIPVPQVSLKQAQATTITAT